MTAARRRLAPNRVHYSRDGIPYCPGCGEVMHDARSYKHLGLLFAFIAYLFKHWEGLVSGRRASPDFKEEDIDGFVPFSPEHLRAWLFVQTKSVRPYVVHRFATKLESEVSLQALKMQYDSLRAWHIYGWPQKIEGGIAVLEPVSIAVYGDNKMSERDFCDVTRRVFDLAYAKLGVDVQNWKETYRKP